MNRIYKRLTAALIILGVVIFTAAVPKQAKAQDPIQIINQDWEASFRDHLTFTLSAESTAEITQADLFYRVVGQIASSRNQAEFTPGTSIEAQFKIDQVNPSNYFPPGAELEYWWKIADSAGNELTTEKETITYNDDRFDWKSLQNERLTLYWYEGSDSFGKSLFERANEALDTLGTDIGITLDDPIKIFIYANHQDLLSALSLTAQEWTGGVAYTEYGVVVIGINPSQLSWGLNAMTHEMSHLVIHQATDNPFSGLPTWLDEGIAVYNENRDELDQDFRQVFEHAVATNQLMTLRTLSSPFPSDPLLANLAYGQSGATVKFIVDTYGSDAMAKLLSIFSEGAIYDEALQQALGVDTDGLDNAFRISLGLPPLPGFEAAAGDSNSAEAETVAEATSTVAADTAGDEEVVTEVAAEEENTQEAEKVATAVTEPESTPAAETSAEASSKTTESSGGVLGFLPCVTGILVLLMMGGGLYILRSR